MDTMETPARSDQIQRHHSLFPFSASDNQMWTESGRGGHDSRSLIGSLVLLHYTAAGDGSPSERDCHLVQPITSTVRSPLCLPPHLFWNPPFPRAVRLIHSDFISNNFSPLSLRFDFFNMRAERDTAIKLNGFNMSLAGIFIKPVHQGSPPPSHTARGSRR